MAGAALVLVAGVARIGKKELVVLAQQVGQFGDVGGIGRGRGNAVHGGESLVFQEMPEVEDGRLVRQGVGDAAKARETADALDFVERALHLAVGEAEPLLHAVDAQHRGQKRHRLAATAP